MIEPEGSTLDLPIRPIINEPAPTFGAPEQTREGTAEERRAEGFTREETVLEDGTHRLRLITDGGERREGSTGMEVAKTITETWDIHPDNPLSARAEASWSFDVGRDDWQTRTETWTEMTCDASRFHVRASLKAYDGKELFFEKTWKFSIPRDGV